MLIVVVKIVGVVNVNVVVVVDIIDIVDVFIGPVFLGIPGNRYTGICPCLFVCTFLAILWLLFLFLLFVSLHFCMIL